MFGGDSFIYLDKKFVYYFYDKLLDNSLHLQILISKWLARINTDYEFDRTNTILGPLKEKNISPIPEFDSNFNKTFKQVCEDAAKDIIDEGKSIDIFWSGGVDSTPIVVAFLNVCKDLKQINIVYDSGSIDEYPLFHEKYIRHITPNPIDNWIYDNVNLEDNIIVTGHGGELLGQYAGMGSVMRTIFDSSHAETSTLKELGFEESDFKTILWQDIFYANKSVFSNPMLDEYFVEHITPQVKKSPIKIETVGDLRWWLSFSMKWQAEKMRSLKFVKKINRDLFQNCKAFFSTDDFQKWAMWNYDKNLRDKLLPYKIHYKEMIYELTRDEDYYKNKGKEWSGKRFAHLRNVKNRFGAVDNKYNRIENIIDKDLKISPNEYKLSIIKKYGNPAYENFCSD